MSELSNKYRKIMNEIDEKITDEEQLNFVKDKKKLSVSKKVKRVLSRS